MRYAIVSDIHANLQAWEAVVADLYAQDADMVISLGDVVGYGPRPLEALEAIVSYADYFVIGNHDAAACGLLDPAVFNTEAERLIRWTAARLGKATLLLEKMPYSVEGDGFTCVHANAHHPASFAYLLDEDSARDSMAAVGPPLMFTGHTHVPAVHSLSPAGEYACYLPGDFALTPGCRYAVNVGSIGLARDGDYRASYCIYDSDRRAVSWRRVDFDMEGYLEDVRQYLGETDQADFLKMVWDESRVQPAPEPVRGETVLMSRQQLGVYQDDFAPDETRDGLSDTSTVRIPAGGERKRKRRRRAGSDSGRRSTIKAGGRSASGSGTGSKATGEPQRRGAALPPSPTAAHRAPWLAAAAAIGLVGLGLAGLLAANRRQGGEPVGQITGESAEPLERLDGTDSPVVAAADSGDTGSAPDERGEGPPSLPRPPPADASDRPEEPPVIPNVTAVPEFIQETAGPVRLLGRWPLAANGADAGPDRHDGVVASEGVFESRDGVRGFNCRRGSVTIDGVGDFERNQRWSIAAWICGDGDGILLSKAGKVGATARGYVLRLDDGHLVFRIFSKWRPPAREVALRSRNPVPLAGWCHLAVSYNGNGKANGMRLFWNGKRLGCSETSTLDGRSVRNDRPLLVGGASDPKFAYNGLIHDLRIYHGTLSSSSIADLAKQPTRATP